jgi:hypothetical protein
MISKPGGQLGRVLQKPHICFRERQSIGLLFNDDVKLFHGLIISDIVLIGLENPTQSKPIFSISPRRGNAILYTIQTIKNLGSAAVGGGEELSNTVAGTNFNNNQTEAWNSIVGYYQQRYRDTVNAISNISDDLEKLNQSP